MIVFSGSEASDARYFKKLSERFCCADHLEEQIDPVRTDGRLLVPQEISRTEMVNKARASWLGITQQRQVFRLVSIGDEPARINTTLPASDDDIELPGRGDSMYVQSFTDFYAEADGPITLMSLLASQAATHVTDGLPGGDPTIVIVPPIEQFRSDYVFLIPDKYIVDFVFIVATPRALVRH